MISITKRRNKYNASRKKYFGSSHVLAQVAQGHSSVHCLLHSILRIAILFEIRIQYVDGFEGDDSIEGEEEE